MQSHENMTQLDDFNRFVKILESTTKYPLQFPSFYTDVSRTHFRNFVNARKGNGLLWMNPHIAADAYGGFESIPPWVLRGILIEMIYNWETAKDLEVLARCKRALNRALDEGLSEFSRQRLNDDLKKEMDWHYHTFTEHETQLILSLHRPPSPVLSE